VGRGFVFRLLTSYAGQSATGHVHETIILLLAKARTAFCQYEEILGSNQHRLEAGSSHTNAGTGS
jgi:hypothetical protein